MRPIHYHTRPLRRLYAIGDPHGCITELQLLLTEIYKDGFDLTLDTILFVGDLVDRGPDSLACMQLVRDTPGIVSVLGNHEDAYLRMWRHEQRLAEEPSYRIPMKLAPYKRANYEHFLTDPAVFKWLDEVPTIRVFDIEGRQKQMVGVHAGLNPVIPTLERQDFTKCRHIRFFSQEKNKPVSQDEDYNVRPVGSVFWFELYRGPKDVVFGHHSFNEVLVHTNGQGTCYGVDTGCCWGDKLSAVRFDASGEKTISIPANENYSQKYRLHKAEATSSPGTAQ